MHQRIVSKKIKTLFAICRGYSTTSGSEYVREPQYPPIFDTTKTLEREKARKHEKINALHTVEEKLFAINLDKYYGHNCMILNEHVYPYQFLPFVKFITRTHVVQENKELFHKVQNVDINECKVNAENIRNYLQEAILFAINGRKDYEDETQAQKPNVNSTIVIESINSVLLSYLSSHYPHILENMVDFKPRLEAFWSVGSFHPSDELYNKRKDDKLSDEEISELVDHWVQYFGTPIIQLRNKLPLPQLETQHLKEYNEDGNLTNIPVENSDPSLTYGIQFQRRHGTNIPGFWPGDENEFGLLSYHDRSYISDRPPHFGSVDQDDTLIAQSVLASYAWLHGQCCYQGFSTFADLTYPLTTQNIITDGRLFNFSLYQLNTTLLHSSNSLNNPRVNLCFALPTQSLYQELRGSEFIGWNDDVLSTLLSFYLNKPQERVYVDMKPYLHQNERYLSDIEHDDRRIWLHKQFRHMYSNRPRHRLLYEIYDWERIYKIKFPTRGMESRARPFERDENPTEDRKYRDHIPPYVPKKFRPKKKHWAGWKANYEKTYYPDL